MINFYDLSPEQFEELCFEYAKKIYDTEKYSLFHTQYRHDGGKDIEVNFYDELHKYKIWAECKLEKRSIGLEEIGKNVVLVIANHINKILFFSASRIRESAKTQILKIAQRLNFEVSFLDDKTLETEICQFSELTRKYFNKVYVDVEKPVDTLQFKCFISENDIESSNLPMEERVYIRQGKIFNLNVIIKNHTQLVFHHLKISFCNLPDTITVLSQSTIDDDIVNPYCDYYYSCICLIKRSDWVETKLPNLIAEYYKDEELQFKELELPIIDLSKNITNPFIGKKYIEFSSKADEIILQAEKGTAKIIDIRGKSGVGKSRISEEIRIFFLRKNGDVFFYDCQEYSDLNLLRKIFCDVLKIPFSKTVIDYSKKDLVSIINERMPGNTYNSDLAMFIYDGQAKKNFQIAFSQIFIDVLQKCIKKTTLFILDNIQENSMMFYNFFQESLTLFLQGCNIFCFCLITNTEYIPKESEKRCKQFLNYLDSQIQKKPFNIETFECMGFSKEDVMLFWMSSLNRTCPQDETVLKLSNHFGDNPLEVTTISDYLKKSKIFMQNYATEWYLVNEEKLNSLFSENISSYDKLFNKRIDNIIESCQAKDRTHITKIISSTVIFNNKTPFDFLLYQKIDLRLIDILIEQKVLRVNNDNNYVSFYHDAIYRFFIKKYEYIHNESVSSAAIKYLVENKNEDSEFLMFFIYLHRGDYKSAKDIGLKLIEEKIQKFEFSKGIQVGAAIYKSDYYKQDFSYYLECSMKYAYCLSSNGNKDYSCEVFMQLCPQIFEHQNVLSSYKVWEFYRDAVNAQLQSFYFENALKVMDYYKQIKNMPLKYQFILWNRESVVNLSLGKFKEADKAFETSMSIAEKFEYDGERMFWTSTAYSDKALFHFYNIPSQDNKSKCIEYFKKAISDYERCVDNTIFRKNEILWHHAFINILEGNYIDSLSYLDKVLNRRSNLSVYTFYRASNLKALALLYLKEYNKAIDLLLKAKSVCELNNYESGTVRIYNNLAVVYWMINEIGNIEEYLKNALNKFPENLFSLKLYPIITNCCAFYKVCQDIPIAKCESIAIKAKDNLLKKYIIEIRHQKRIETCPGMTMWSFKGLDYVY